MTATFQPAAPAGGAFERITDLLRAEGKVVRVTGNTARAQCPGHDPSSPSSLTIYRRPGRAKIVCWVVCEDTDVLAALGLGVPDLFDEPRLSPIAGKLRPRPFKPARPRTQVERALDRLLELPDLGERLCLAIARTRPELYIADREGLW
jgi:hypothetical protein